MTKKTKSRIIAALALTTALSAPALIMPLVTAPPALAGEATHDFADLAAKVTPAVVNVAVTMKADAGDDEIRMSGKSPSDMEEFMRQFSERFGGGKGMPKMQPKPQQNAQAVGTGFIIATVALFAIAAAGGINGAVKNTTGQGW